MICRKKIKLKLFCHLSHSEAFHLFLKRLKLETENNRSIHDTDAPGDNTHISQRLLTNGSLQVFQRAHCFIEDRKL